MHRRVACAKAAEYGGEIPGGIADELDKGFADGAGLDEEPGDGTDDGAGLAEGLADGPVERRQDTRGADERRRVCRIVRS